MARIKSVLEISGGFGTVVGFVHDWANPENTMRSWDMVARYVVPEINGYLAGLRHVAASSSPTTARCSTAPREAIMAKITENEAAAAALAVTRGSRLGDVASASNVPDLDQARRDQEGRGRAGGGVRSGPRGAAGAFGHPVPRSSLTISRVARISMPRYA